MNQIDARVAKTPIIVEYTAGECLEEFGSSDIAIVEAMATAEARAAHGDAKVLAERLADGSIRLTIIHSPISY